MSFMQGKIGADGHYYESRMHSSGQSYVVRDGHEVVSGLTGDVGHTGRFMDKLGGYNTTRPMEHDEHGDSVFDSLENFRLRIGSSSQPTARGQRQSSQRKQSGGLLSRLLDF